MVHPLLTAIAALGLVLAVVVVVAAVRMTAHPASRLRTPRRRSGGEDSVWVSSGTDGGSYADHHSAGHLSGHGDGHGHGDGGDGGGSDGGGGGDGGGGD